VTSGAQRCPCGKEAVAPSCGCERCDKPMCASCVEGSVEEATDAATPQYLCLPCYDRQQGVGRQEEDDGG